MVNVILILDSGSWSRQDGGSTSEANVSSGTFTFALKPSVATEGEGNRLATFNVPSVNFPIIQVMGSEAQTIQLQGQLRNTRTKTNSAIADKQCITWAFKNAKAMTITLDTGETYSNMIIRDRRFIRIGDVVGGFAYDITFMTKAITTPAP